jgi:hypothetical protein
MSKKNNSTATTSNTFVFRRIHPKNRASFWIPGVAGLLVVDLKLFANGKAPKSLTVDAELTVPAPEEPAKPTTAKGKASE